MQFFEGLRPYLTHDLAWYLTGSYLTQTVLQRSQWSKSYLQEALEFVPDLSLINSTGH